MIEINGKTYRNIQEQVGENQENIEALQSTINSKHIYEHLLYVYGKLKDAGETKDDFLFSLRCRILNTSPTKITKDNLASAIGTNNIPAGGMAHYTTAESQYTIFSIGTSILDRNVLEISTVTIDYTPAGQSSSVVGELINVIDKVNTLL